MTSDSILNEFVGQVDRILEELADVSRKTSDASQFFEQLLSRTNLLLTSQASVIWHIGPDDSLLPLKAQVTDEASSLQFIDAVHPELQAEIRERIHSGNHGRFFRADRKKETFAIVWPLRNFKPAAALVVGFSAKPKATDEPVYTKVVEALAELADDFFASAIIRHSEQIDRDYKKLAAFSVVINQDLKFRSTAITLVNHSRDFLDADRVGLLKRQGSRCALVASSGAQQVNRRSETSRALEAVVSRLMHRNEKPVVYHKSDSNESPNAMALAVYAQQNELETIMLIPVRGNRTAQAAYVIVVEFKDPIGDLSATLQRLNTIEPQARAALNNAQKYESLPFLGCMVLLQRALAIFGSTRKTLYSLILIGMISAMVSVLVLCKTELKVHTRGEIQIDNEQAVFAPIDGYVSEVFIAHGKSISKDDTLITLRSDSLDLDIATAEGKLEIAKKKLDSQETAQAAYEQDDSTDQQANLIRLAGEIIETKEQISYLDNELKILKAKRGQLIIKSPLAGEITTWDLQHMLAKDRPIRRGDRLAQIVPADRVWIANLLVPSDEISHLLGEDFAIREDVQVVLTIASAPDQEWTGTITEVSRLAEPAEADQFSQVRIQVTLDGDTQKLNQLRPGTTVVSNIRCGKVSLAYFLFHRVARAIHFRFF